MSWLSTELYFYPGSAPCRAVLMALKYLKVEFEEKPIDLLKAENMKPWFVRLNRLHTVPTLKDKNYAICESRAIMMFLCNKHCMSENRSFYPTDPEERGNVDKMLFFDMEFSFSLNEYFKPKLYHGLSPEPEKENKLKQSLDYLDSFLEDSGKKYMCSDNITIADISILATTTDLDALDYNYKYYGEFNRYITRLKENLPFFKECCEEGVQMTRDRVKQLEDDVKKQIEKERKQTNKK